jgi:hypothetical protein
VIPVRESKLICKVLLHLWVSRIAPENVLSADKSKLRGCDSHPKAGSFCWASWRWFRPGKRTTCPSVKKLPLSGGGIVVLGSCPEVRLGKLAEPAKPGQKCLGARGWLKLGRRSLSEFAKLPLCRAVFQLPRGGGTVGRWHGDASDGQKTIHQELDSGARFPGFC